MKKKNIISPSVEWSENIGEIQFKLLKYKFTQATKAYFICENDSKASDYLHGYKKEKIHILVSLDNNKMLLRFKKILSALQKKEIPLSEYDESFWCYIRLAIQSRAFEIVYIAHHIDKEINKIKGEKYETYSY